MNAISVNVPTQQIIQQLLPQIKNLIMEELAAKGKPEGFLTAQEVCELLQISESTLWRRTKDGSIQAETVGRLKRFPKSQFN